MQHKKGFTLVELLIYSVIFAGVSLTLVYFLSTFFRVSGYQASSSEVANQANFILGKIQNEIATSTLVVVNDTNNDEVDDTPLNTPHGKLFLKTKNETTGGAGDTESPVLIYKNGSNVVLKRGNGPETALNNSSVAVTNLAFTKVSTPPGKDVVLIDLTLQYQSSNAVDRISRDFSLGVSRAQAAAFDSSLSPNGGGYSLGTGAAKWASLFLSGGATIDGPLALTDGNTNTTNNSITFLKQGTLVVNPNANIPANTTTQFFVSSGTYPELQGIKAGDRVFLTPPAGSTAASRLEVGISFIGARTLADSIEINLRNTTGAAIFAGSHNWGYLVIR